MKPADTGSRDACHSGMASQLSPRQREILDLVAEGRTSKEIAAALGISESTVNWHLANVFTRLGASSRAEAVALAIRSNGTDRVIEAPTPIRRQPLSVRAAWPRLVALAIAIAIAGAVLGGATVAALRPGPATPAPGTTASPTNGSVRSSIPSPTDQTHEEVLGGDVAPIGGGTDFGTEPTAPVVVPNISAPPLPSVPVPLPTALPSLPVPVPPLPSLPIPLPSPIPTLPPPPLP